MNYRKANNACEYDECDLDSPFDEFTEDDHATLMVVRNISPLEESVARSFQTEDRNSEFKESQEDKEEGYYFPSQTGSCSSLHIYMKTLSRFSPLNEEEEIFLARTIKEQEKKCLKLLIQWRGLFKKGYLTNLSARRIQKIREQLQSLHDTFNLFDHLVKLERTHKSIERELKKKSKTGPKRQEEFYRVKAEIAKGIAEINLSKTTIKRMMSDLNKLSHNNYQRIVKRALGRILRDINHVSKEIKASKNQLVQSHLRLVIFMAKRYMHGGLSLPDLIQEGNMGLIRAIDTYDYNRSHRFISYASWWIRQSFIRALNSKSMTIRKPVHISETLYKINQASNRLAKECNREPTLDEIAQKTHASLESIENVMQSFNDPVSLDSFDEERGESMINLPQNKKPVFIPEPVMLSNLSQTIDAMLSNLTPREEKIVKLRFGIGSTHDHTLEEIGGEFGLSKERIRQILETVLDKLKQQASVMELKDFIGLN